jgi:predicted nucleic acid-binding protein
MPDSLYVVDTHVLVWYLDGDDQLSTRTKEILDNPDARLLIPSIVLSEALFLLERRPGLYALSETKLLQEVEQDPRMSIVALDQQIVTKTLDCKAVSEIHDRQIVATALLAQSSAIDVAILTRDENITTSGLVPVIW